VLSRKYDPTIPEGRFLFYTSRALRIFVPYWSFCIVIIGAYALLHVLFAIRFGVDAAYAQYWPEMSGWTRIYLVFTNIFIFAQDWAMWLGYDNGALVPMWSSDFQNPHLGTFQLIPQAWSISLELMFYLLAPWLIRRHWLSLLAIIVTTYLLRSVASAYGFTGSGFAYRFFPFELGLFLAGVLSYRVYAYVSLRYAMPAGLSLGLCVLFLAIVLVQQYVDRLDNHRFYILVVAMVPVLFEVSRRSRFDRWLGELSYPIYLGHLAVLTIGNALVSRAGGPVEDHGRFVLTVAIATALLAVAYVRWIDAPFESWRQRRAARLLPPRHSQPPIGARPAPA